MLRKCLRIHVCSLNEHSVAIDVLVAHGNALDSVVPADISSKGQNTGIILGATKVPTIRVAWARI